MNNNGLRIIEKEINGKLIIRSDSQYNNINATCVILEEEVTARLFGTINEQLVLKNGSRIYLHGNIKGRIENRGGELHLYK